MLLLKIIQYTASDGVVYAHGCLYLMETKLKNQIKMVQLKLNFINY